MMLLVFAGPPFFFFFCLPQERAGLAGGWGGLAMKRLAPVCLCPLFLSLFLNRRQGLASETWWLARRYC